MLPIFFFVTRRLIKLRAICAINHNLPTASNLIDRFFSLVSLPQVLRHLIKVTFICFVQSQSRTIINLHISQLPLQLELTRFITAFKWFSKLVVGIWPSHQGSYIISLSNKPMMDFGFNSNMDICSSLNISWHHRVWIGHAVSLLCVVWVCKCLSHFSHVVHVVRESVWLTFYALGSKSKKFTFNWKSITRPVVAQVRCYCVWISIRNWRLRFSQISPRFTLLSWCIIPSTWPGVHIRQTPKPC